MVIDLHTLEVDMELRKLVGGEIRNLKLFGKNEDRLIVVTRGGYVFLFTMNYRRQTAKVVSQYKINLIKNRLEEPISISVCDKHQYALVEARGFKMDYLTSRMMIFQVSEDKLVKKAVMDVFRHQVPHKVALEFYGYVGEHLLWVGLTVSKKGHVQVFDYHPRKKELREVREKRIEHQEKHPRKVQRVGDEFYYTGTDGKIMKFALSF